MSTRVLPALKRIAGALPFAAFCAYSLYRAFGKSGHPIEIMAWLLYAASMLVVIAVIFAFPIAGIIGEHIGRFYLPGGSDVPPPHYPLARIYEREAKWDLALAESEKIILYHPDELPAHIARVRITIRAHQDLPQSRRYLKNSLRRLRDPRSRQELRENFESLSREPAESSIP